MATVNKFYATYSDENNRHQFDIKELPREMWRGFAPLFSFADGSTQGGEVLSSDTTSEDYDGQFIQALWEIEPIQEIHVFLNYHYLKFGSKKGITEKEVFVNHIRYSIYPRIKSAVGGQGDVVKDWIDQKIAEIQEIKSQQKLAFLEHAYRYSKGDSATQINMDELKSIIGTDGQIVQELLSIGYIELGAESNMFTLSSAGLKYAERNFKEANTTNSLSIGAINNASVQVQMGANNSHQSQTITTPFSSEERSELFNFVRDLNHSLEELKSYLQESEIRNLQSDLMYLENISNRETANNGTLKNVLKGIGGVLKKVPEKVIASIVTEYMKAKIF